MLHCAAMPVARLLYTLLLVVALPAAALFLLWRSRRHQGYRRHWRERFLGRSPSAEHTGPWLWVHAVSLGETRAAQPLIEALLARYPDQQVLLTHGTPSGRDAGQELFGERVARAYLPYDLPWAVSAFLDQQRPVLGILMETEVWPNLLAACASRGIPVCLANARLSARSFAGYQRLKWLAKRTFADLTLVLAQTSADADRLRRLGARRVEITGNLKSDAEPDPRQVERGIAWRCGWDAAAATAGRPTRRVWLAASTREREDAALIEAARRVTPSHLMVWVPRHPHRVPEIVRALQAAGLTCEKRSETLHPSVDTHVWIGDTLGELAAYIAAADVVFVGGSLVPLGGQNLLEPCAQGKPVLAGPHTFNFLELTDAAVREGAAERVDGAEALAEAVSRLLMDPSRCAGMGDAGRRLRANHAGSLTRTLARIEDLLAGAVHESPDSPGSGSALTGTR